MQQQLLDNIKSKKIQIGVIGMGYVGIPLALRCSEIGFKVLGFDIDPEKVDKINNGISYIKYIPDERIANLVNQGLLTATNHFKNISEVDAVIICVPTPLGKHHEPDVSYIQNTMAAILPYVRKGQVITLESTTYPGTTEEEICRPLEDKGFIVGKDVFVVYSPEREDPGNINFSTHTIPKVVGGHTPQCQAVGVALYQEIIEKVVPVESTKVAEMTKLLENIFRAVNIGLVNELKMVADKMDIDIWSVIKAAATKPFGFMSFSPGPGLGGHCIPIDPFYLTWKAKEYNIHTRFIELAGEINTRMPEWVITKTIEALNNQGKALQNAHVLLLGLSYKKNVDDSRESPSAELIELLLKKGANVQYSDEFIPQFPKMRKYDLNLESVKITKELLDKTDCVLLATDHDYYDYEFIQQHSKLIIDTRGRYKTHYNNVVKA